MNAKQFFEHVMTQAQSGDIRWVSNADAMPPVRRTRVYEHVAPGIGIVSCQWIVRPGFEDICPPELVDGAYFASACLWDEKTNFPMLADDEMGIVHDVFLHSDWDAMVYSDKVSDKLSGEDFMKYRGILLGEIAEGNIDQDYSVELDQRYYTNFRSFEELQPEDTWGDNSTPLDAEEIEMLRAILS